ncbi:hypothetical protein [uncultured Mesonia sp.]|uniref:LPD3 domain-containing protein n=1 Tax=uncultured Mesonia sp. TaxID=399731 RepID=UPI00374F0ED5
MIGIKNQIKISTENFKEFSTPELRAFILKYYNLFLKNKTLAIKNSLQKVELLSRAGRKISKGSAAYKAKAAVIEHFEVVLKNSTYNNWGEPKPKDSPDLLGYMNFKSKVNIDGKNRHVRISVEVFKDKKTLLKSYEVGKKKTHLSKESQKLSSSPNEVIKSDKKPLSYSKDTKKEVSKPQNDVKNKLNQNHKPGLQVGQPLPQPLPQPVEYPVNKNSLAARMAANKNKVYNYYTISNPELSKFLGKIEIKEKESV